MKGNFDACLKEVLLHEGGYSNHASDPGGRTNLGVTQATYEAWVGYPVTEKIMRSLTIGHVRTLYKVKYWDAIRGDELPTGIDLCAFDFAVNAGPNRSARYLQRLVGAKDDGAIGPKTLSLLQQTVKALGLPHVVNQYQDARETYYKRLATFATFGRGWLRRVSEVRAEALRMVALK